MKPKFYSQLWLIAMLVLILATACGTTATEAPAAAPEPEAAASDTPIDIIGAWSRSTPEMMEGTGIVYMTIQNNTDAPDRFVAAKTDAAKVVELHETTIDDKGVMRMRMVKGGYIEVPANGAVELDPGGLHVMLVELQQPLVTGESFPLTMKFENAGEFTVDIPIVDLLPEEAAIMEQYEMDHDMMAEGEMDHDAMAEESDDAAAEMDHDAMTETADDADAMAHDEMAGDDDGEMSMAMDGDDSAAAMPAAGPNPGPVPTPRAPEDVKGGLFVSLTTDKIDTAAMAIGFATKVLNGTEKPVTIFLNVEGVRLVDTHIPQSTHKGGMTMAQMLTKFMDDGGVVLVCPVCMKNVGGLNAEEVLDGVIVGTPEYTWSAMFAEDVTVLNY